METTTIQPPRTAMEVFKMLPEGTLCEVINNQILMAASPFGRHQRLSVILENKFFNWLQQHAWGEILHAPIDVYLDEVANAVQPDIIILQNGSAAHIDDDGFVHGSPAIIIEILSVGNKDHDKIIKKNLYEKFGVQEYFIVDPETKSVIHYWLTTTGYQLQQATVSVLRSKLLNADFEF